MLLIPENLRNLWNGLEMRLLVMLSLTLQIILIFFAAFRKRSADKTVSFVLWASYLGADYVATLALGNLLSKQTDYSEKGINGDLVALWAPFLLLHLGGPDAITSYSLEDNQLWLRHLLGVIVQVSTALLAFLLSLPNPGLWQPAIAVFISGAWKYVERTLTLRAASMDELRESMVTDPDPGPNYVKFMQEYASLNEAGLEAKIEIESEPQPKQQLSEIKEQDIEDDMEVIIKAHELFNTFKRLAADLMLSFQDRIDSQYFFFERSAVQAFRVVEIELSFLYDILYTKSRIIHGLSGFVIRFFTFCVTLAAALLFHHYIRHHSFNKADVVVTYVLLVAAVTLEAISIVMLLLSDWMIVALEKRKFRKCARFLSKVGNSCLPSCEKWWSNSMMQHNLISCCVAERKVSYFKSALKFLKLKELWDNWWYIDSSDVPHALKDLIFGELKGKAQGADNSEDYKQLRACRGDWVLRYMNYTQFAWTIESREYDESILLWHIATDLLIHANPDHTGDDDKHNNKKKNIDTEDHDDDKEKTMNTDHNNNNAKKTNYEHKDDNHKMSILISNYMVYLIVTQPAMLPAGIGKIRFQDTCAEAKKFLSTMDETLNKEKACVKLLEVNADIDPRQVKGDRSKSVLFDACRLAKQLQKDEELTEERRWKLISAVWVELMGYAAGSCRSYFHSKQLSLGGELLTHVWLMMAHMGIGEQYRIESGHARAKLLVKK